MEDLAMNGDRREQTMETVHSARYPTLSPSKT